MADEELLVLYQQTGDLEVLGDLYQRYLHLVMGVCMKYLKDTEESKDMTMHIFEKVSTQLKNHEVVNFKSWLHVVTKNQCLMLLRSKKYKAEKEIVEIISENGMDLSFTLHHEDNEHLELRLQEMEIALEELPPEQKACVKLFYLQQKCYKEIVDITGYDINKVKSYIQNGKRNLKNHLQKLDEQP